MGDRRLRADYVTGYFKGVIKRSSRTETQTSDSVSVSTDNDYLTEVIKCMSAPIPHVERVNSMIRVRRSVEMSVPFIFSESFFEALAHYYRIFGLAQNSFKKINVAWVVDRVKFPWGRMRHYYHSAFANEWLSAVHVKKVSKA